MRISDSMVLCSNSPEVKKMTDIVYQVYGSSTGYLFGLDPAKKHIAEAIITAVMRIQESEE